MLQEASCTTDTTNNSLSAVEQTQQVEDYTLLLRAYGIECKEVGYYLQVGEISQIQGWIIHISVIKNQLDSLLTKMIPLLIEQKIPFKIPVNKDIHGRLLDGSIGYTQLGKIVSIYLPGVDQNISFIKKIVSLTLSIKGPAVPTAHYLGGAVYTRYGGFSPVLVADEYGSQQPYIYDSKGKLIKDAETAPFTPLPGIKWPFIAIKPYTSNRQKKILHRVYLPYIVIKSDAKGRVIKAISIKRLFHIDWCLIKEGKKYMCTDESGRDIRDRLLWQQELHNKLYGSIPLPKILDTFIDQGDMYLVMEFIEGDSLDQWQADLYDGKSWQYLPLSVKLLVLDTLLIILSVIGQLHQKEYIHRDITPANFLVDKKGRVFLIDVELAYHKGEQRPYPPFKIGTKGYISPEQQLLKTPTEKEDIYGIGALLLASFLRISPVRIETKASDIFKENILFFIGDENIVSLIMECLEADPIARPGLQEIIKAVQFYRAALVTGEQLLSAPDLIPDIPNQDWIRKTIQCGLEALGSSTMLGPDKIWFSKNKQGDSYIDNEQLQCNYYPGLQDGLSGVAYLLAAAKQCGFEIQSCMESYHKSWVFISEQQLNHLPNTPPGLYDGTAGTAVALTIGMECGLLPVKDELKMVIHNCLDRLPAGYDLATGAAGQGIALIRCTDYLETDFLNQHLVSLKEYLIANQQKDGYWKTAVPGEKNNQAKTMGLSNGIAGIIYFLLVFAEQFQDSSAHRSSMAGLHWLQEKIKSNGKVSGWAEYANDEKGTAWAKNGVIGIVLCYLKAYEVLKDDNYRKLAEGMLMNYPPFISHADFTQNNGLAGLGEVYLEAYKVCKDEQWKKRAEWIVNLLLHTRLQGTGCGNYWIIDNSIITTAGLMTGNSGILHLLLRYLYPEAVSYPIISVN